jgi:hypothetical protein
LDQRKPLSKTVVLNVLRRFKKEAIPERKLVEIVNEDGVDFRLTLGIERELKQAGASKTLIEAIRQNCRGLQCPLPKFEYKTVKLGLGCEDDILLDDHYIDAPSDGSARSKRIGLNLRVVRGGSFRSPGEDCRSAKRGRLSLDSIKDDLGFRVVCGARTN